MEYTIALCDDEQIQLEIIKSYIEKISSDIKFEFDLHLASSGEELLDILRNRQKNSDENIDVFFLDIEMKELNGLEVGMKIRKKYKDALIIFITGFKDYALNAFNIRAFDYIIKPLSYEKFEVLFKDIIERLELMSYKKKCEKVFVVKNKEIIYKIPYEDIYYFEKKLHKIKIVGVKDTFEFYGSLKNLIEEIDMTYFTRCHKGIIVNNEKIYSYKNHQIFIEELDDYIPVSRSYIKDIKKIISQELFD